MYLGNLGPTGTTHMVLELVANSIDCFLAGNATEIGVTLHADHIEVWDDGCGFPLEPDGRGNEFLTTHHNLATADGHAPHIHLVSMGVGIVAVNALSERFEVEALRGGQGWRQSGTMGVLEEAQQVEEVQRGTRIQFWPDTSILQSAQPDEMNLRRMLFDAVHLFPGLKIHFQDETFFALGGLLSLASFLAGGGHYGGSTDGILVRETIDKIRIEVALAGSLPQTYGKKKAAKPTVRSWANGALTEGHGSHVKGVKSALKGSTWQPAVWLVHVVMEHPVYAGPCRDRLGLPEVRKAVKKAVKTALADYRTKGDF